MLSVVGQGHDLDLQRALCRGTSSNVCRADTQMMLKHPDLFGMSGPIAWAELWNSLGPLAELVMKGTSVSKEDGERI